MAWAQRTGVLHEFNQGYRRRRLEAQRRGELFRGYGQATARLWRAITKVAADTAPVAVVRKVLGDGVQSLPCPGGGTGQSNRLRVRNAPPLTTEN
jgi:hypothetical protein